MRLAAFLLTILGGVIALVAAGAVLLIVADQSVQVPLSLAALFGLAIIVLALLARKGSYASSGTRNAVLVLVLLSAVALVLGIFSPVFALRPLLVGYGLSLIGGVITLLVSRRLAMA
jgi:hypothetical protein